MRLLLCRSVRCGVQRTCQRVQHSGLPAFHLPQKAGNTQHSRDTPTAGHNGRVGSGSAFLCRNAQHIGPVHGGSIRGHQVVRRYNHRAGQAGKVLCGHTTQQAQQALGHIVQICRALGHGLIRHVGHHICIASIYALYSKLCRVPVAQYFRLHLFHNHFIIRQIKVRVKNGRLLDICLFKALPQCMQLFPCFGPRRSIGEAFFLYLLCRGKLLSGTQRLRRININGAHCHTRRHRISMKYHTVRPFPAAMAWRSFS